MNPSALPAPPSALGRFSTQQIQIIFASDLSCAKTLAPVRFTDTDGAIYEVPACQPTDFASTPPTTWGFPLYLIPTGWWAIPALFHDSAFQNLLRIIRSHLDGSESWIPANLTEQESNDLLKRMMQTIKPTPTLHERLQLDAIYEGVTLGGWHAFKEDRS